ncbi:SIR2 family protein [Clostridium botulinum]|nr:SIR2 family protein [Clostridium botulinum]MBY6772009.1 SIR2 family protein [Clostridium botulinum]MBY6884921.1 SIR2 family protein [Clostridium botulinum]HBJ1685304.1 SIR2 family protein [Clostridium botulinum]
MLIMEMKILMKDEIESMVNTIKQEAQHNKLVIFIGAGVSNNSGYKSWNDLIKIFDKEIGYSKDKNKQYSTDELLKIPQYFFNENPNRYKEILKANYKKLPTDTNPIIDVLIQMNPHHIITTNFDCLIEMSLEKNNIYGCPAGDDLSKYKVICKDSDLVSAPKSNFLIKMHGDLDNFDHMVLKENDYLKYSNTHILIETYIKSLLIDHTFLFVGYRLGDYNLKLIMSWVENIIKKYDDDFEQLKKQHYFINPDYQPLNRFEKEYYKEKNICVIEFSQIPKEYVELAIDNIDHPLGKNLYKVCKYILDGNKIDKKIDDIYTALLEFEGIDMITSKDLFAVLGELFPWNNHINNVFNYNPQFISQATKECISIFKGEEKSEKINFIKRIFLKAGISELYDESNDCKICLGDKYKYTITELMINFDFKGIDKLRESLANSLNPMDILKFTYLQCYFLGKDERIKELMVGLLNVFRQAKDYFHLIIIEHNLLVTFQSDRARYKNITNVLPKDTKDKYTTLLEYLDGFESLYLEVAIMKTKTFDKLNPYYYKVSTELGEKNSDYKKFKTRLNDILSYLFENCIITNRYKGANYNISKLMDIFKEYIDLALCFISPKSNARIVNERTGDQYERTSLSKIDMFIAIYYLEPEYLSFLLKKHNIKDIFAIEEVKEYILSSFENMINSLNFVFPLNSSKTVDILENFLIVIEKISYEENKYEFIFKKIISIFQKIIEVDNDYDYTMCFNFLGSLIGYTNRILKLHSEIIPENILKSFIENFINTFISKNFEEAKYYIEFIDQRHILYNMANFLAYYYSSRLNVDLSIKFVEHCKNKWPIYYYDFIIQIYPILSLNLCTEISENFHQNVETLSCERLYRGLLNRVIEYNKEVKSRFITLCRLYSNNIKNKSVELYDVNNPLYVVARLVERGIIRDIETYREFFGILNFFDFICFPEQFDFQYFDVNWSSWFTVDRYVNIGIRRAYEVLKTKYKSAMENGPQEIVKVIYYRYFYEINI